MMLVTCYRSTGENQKMREAARTSVDRAKGAIAKEPTNGSALAGGAVALVMLGEEERAREWMQRALLLDPDSLNMRYNVACVLAAELGDSEQAIEALRPYFENSNSPTRIRHLEADPDLDTVREQPSFKEMLAAAKQRLGMAEAAASA